jgi:uncharacterized protein HemX
MNLYLLSAILGLFLIKTEIIVCQTEATRTNQINKIEKRLQNIQKQQNKNIEQIGVSLKKNKHSVDSLKNNQRAIHNLNLSMQDSICFLNNQLLSMKKKQQEQFDTTSTEIKKFYTAFVIISGVLFLALIVICAVLFTYIRKRIDKMEQKMIYYNEREIYETEETRDLFNKKMKDWKRIFKDDLSKTQKKIKKEIKKK